MAYSRTCKVNCKKGRFCTGKKKRIKDLFKIQQPYFLQGELQENSVSRAISPAVSLDKELAKSNEEFSKLLRDDTVSLNKLKKAIKELNKKQLKIILLITIEMLKSNH